jgi:serine/threonine-protein kinase
LEILAVSYERPKPSNELTNKINNKISRALAKWLSWGFVGLTTVSIVWGIGDALPQLVEQGNPLGLVVEIAFRLFPLTFAVLASLIINRQPNNIVGWLMVFPVLGGILSFIAESYLHDIVVPPIEPSFLLLLMIWIDSTSWTLFIFPIILIPLFFPDGRPPSPRWNWVAYYAGAVLLFFYGIVAVSKEFGPSDFGPNVTPWIVTNPIGFVSNDIIDRFFGLPWSIALLLLVAACMAALIVRYRSGTSVEQAQIKWVVYASLFFGITYIALLPISFESENIFLNTLFSFLFAFSLSVVPLGISIAILRYRLWDIDFVINRSLVYGALTALLAALLGGGLYVVSHLFQNLTGGPLVAVAASAAVFGGIFQPARRQLQRFVDRRFYHIEIDYQKTPPNLAIGSMTQVLRQTNFGVYQDLELIGRGGMAEVYKSLHPTLGVPVAIKILPPKLAVETEFRQRFAREAKVIAKLEHPNIVRIFDSGEQDGRFYMVMEYLVGKDLDQLIKNNGRLPIAKVLSLVQQFASALDYAHTEGFVHRDIKPSNVLLDTSSNNDTHAVLTDFGIAKNINAHTAMTRTGYMLGTFDYIAPEQIQESANVDGKADIYALGVMVYQMLTGELPFKQINPGALLIAHLNQPPPDPREILPDLPSHVSAAIQRAMAKKPEERFATATEFAMEIDRAET